MKFYNVLVLGCGASGSIAAIKASEKYEKVGVIDRANRVAKKLLVTGNGRCNLTNSNANADNYNIDITPYLKRFGIKETLDFFESLGLATYADEEGRVYPISNSAKSVFDILENKFIKTKIECYLEHEIISVERWENNFLVKTDKDEFLCEKLVVALGGNFASEILDISDLRYVPSLVSLKANVSRNLSGCKLSNVKVSAQNSFGERKTEEGEVLFKEKGLSGICIFNLSTIFSRINNFNGKISIDIFPSYSHEQLFELLKKRKSINEKINKFFDGLLLPQIAYEILNRLKFDENRNANSLTDNEIKKMVNVIKNLDFAIAGNLDNNQVFAGGIDLNSLTSNLEHKDIKNLYFCGEACNVDGECGGYNLQWAWTSGYIVGESL